MLSANPELPAWHVKSLMEQTCTDLVNAKMYIRDMEIRPLGMLIDIAVFLFVLFVAAFGFERCVVRNPRIGQWKWTYWDDAYWP